LLGLYYALYWFFLGGDDELFKVTIAKHLLGSFGQLASAGAIVIVQKYLYQQTPKPINHANVQVSMRKLATPNFFRCYLPNGNEQKGLQLARQCWVLCFLFFVAFNRYDKLGFLVP